MNWDDVRVFVALVRAESLSLAARTLKVEHSTVARRIDSLEKSLGVRLFDRLPRGWRLTVEGEQLFARAEQMEEKAHAFQREAADGTTLSGTVRLSAPPVFSSSFLVPQLAARQERWSQVMLEVVGEIRLANLVRREADLAVRMGRPQDPGLATRPLGAMSYGLYAHRSYFDSRAPQDWKFIGYDDSLRHAPEQQWLENYAGGRAFSFRSNSLASLFEAARHGLGIALLPHVIAAAHSELVELPGGASPDPRELWLVIHPDVRRSPRVRLIADIVTEVVTSSEEVLLRTS